MRLRGYLAVLAGLASVQCFAVPERGCEDPSGLFVEHHVCMPEAGFDLGVAKLMPRLTRADFDGEGIANDLAGLAYVGDPEVPETLYASVFVVQMRKELGAPAAGEVDVPVGTLAVTPVYVGSDRQSLAYVLDESDGMGAGTIGLIRNMGGGFDPNHVVGPLSNPLQGCRLPNGITTVEDAPVVLVTCTRDDTVVTMPPFFQGDLGSVGLDMFVESGGTGVYFAGLTHMNVAGLHGTVLFDADADGVLDGAGISLPTMSDGMEAVNLRHDKIVVVKVPMGDKEEISLTAARLEDGPIEDLYAAELDGAEPVELITRHESRGRLTILRQAEAGTSKFAAVGEPLAVPQPLDVAVGDFTGDGAPDIAVAYVEAGVSKLGVFIRLIDADLEYVLVPMGGVGEDQLATGVTALDVDDDGAMDLAVAVLVPEVGTAVRVYLNRAGTR